MKILITGLWICAVTIASCYGAVTFGGGIFSDKKASPISRACNTRSSRRSTSR